MPQTSRRVFLSAVAAGLCLNSLPGDAFSEPEAAVPPSPQPVATVIPLWPAEPPGGGGPDEALPMISPAGSISRIARPQLQVFRPARPNGAAVLVAGGGGVSAHFHAARISACGALVTKTGGNGFCSFLPSA
ncbi:hypothetical protein LHT11_04970 [Acetobacter indonesiensis]|uniref:hypothetical protein n=1 Tax=Acetobacter indonesiensis TaxID=104101 RepID=UPI001F442769|nr:hypothetical protein [Acetobacter indonesiensis]MCG0994554.1 hypothetical protein [Acetobacter indonesiensis]